MTGHDTTADTENRGRRFLLGSTLRDDEPHDGVGHQQDERGPYEEPAFHGLPVPPPPRVSLRRAHAFRISAEAFRNAST